MENEKKEVKKIGIFTFGIILILLGISALIQIFFPFELLRYILMLWPILFISLGIEAIYYNYKKDIQIKYSFGSIMLVIFLITVASMFAVGNYFINGIIYNTNNTSTINESLSQKRYAYKINSNKFNLINLSGKQVNLSIINSEDGDNKIYINAKYNLTDKNPLIFEILNSNLYNCFLQNSDNSIITISELPNYIDYLDIIIYTNNIDSISQSNCTLGL